MFSGNVIDFRKKFHANRMSFRVFRENIFGIFSMRSPSGDETLLSVSLWSLLTVTKNTKVLSTYITLKKRYPNGGIKWNIFQRSV